MSASAICRYCGKPVLPNAIGGLCPECLLKAALASNAGTVPMSGFIPPSVEELKAHFPQLELIELIGHGGMGAVYKARQPGLNRFVAVKVLPGDHSAANSGFAERFQREAQALAKLSHPNIVAVYDFGRAGGFHFLVMEFVEGVTMRSLLREGKLAPEKALLIVPQICEALQFAHDAGIVHRDIKPENILIDSSGRVKIADFGLAKILAGAAPEQAITQVGHRMGTPHYMAPEQVEKPEKVDHRADIYSLGVVFYELLTGELPLGRFSPPSKRAQIDFRLDEVVLRALEKEPAKRYQQASHVKTEITSAGLERKTWPYLRSHAKSIIAGVIILVALSALMHAKFRHRRAQMQAEALQAATLEQLSVPSVTNAGLPETPLVMMGAPADAPLAWPQRIEAMNRGTWRQALATAEALAALPPDEGWTLVQTYWGAVTNAESRKQFLKAFTFASHPKLIPLLELGVLDQALPVQSWALTYLKSVSGRDFAENYAAASEYLAARRDWPLDDALRETARDVAARLRGANDDEIRVELKRLDDLSLLREKGGLLQGSGLEESLEQIILDRSQDLGVLALKSANSLTLSDYWYRRVAAPRLAPTHSVETRIAAAQVFQGAHGDWTDPLLTALADLPKISEPQKNSLAFSVGSAIGKSGSAKAVHPIIQIIEKQPNYATLYGLGYFALTPLTGVPYDEKHDAAWWTNWWENNKGRFETP